MLNNRLGDIEVNLCVCTELIWMSQSKIFWQTFQSRWVYLEIINQSIPTGFIFVKIYCYELFVCLCYCAPASYRPYSSHLSTSAGPRYSVCFVRSRTFVPRISWFVILIHFYCANESKDIAMHCCGGKGKKYTQKKIDSKPRMVHSLSSVGKISKGRQLRGNKSGLKKKKNRKKNQPTK